MAVTFSPDPTHLAAGAGTAATQAARPREYANHQAGGWGPNQLAKATGATAGTPGGFTPAPSYIPEDLDDMAGVTAAPATAWTALQRVATFDGQECHWSGTAWVAGRA